MAKFKFNKRRCKSCGEGFMATRFWHEYCSDVCRVAYYRKTHPQLSPEELRQIKEKLGIKE